MANLKNSLLSKLNSVYQGVGNKWVMKNSFVLTYAHMDNVALCGSVGKSVCMGRPYNDIEPNDIDFVTKSLQDALGFHNRICKRLSQYAMYYKVYHNSKTEFCQSGCEYHIRILSPFWMPICIFVVPNAEFWVFNNKFYIQNIDQIIKAQNEINNIKSKGTQNHNSSINEKLFLNDDIEGNLNDDKEDNLNDSAFTIDTKKDRYNK